MIVFHHNDLDGRCSAAIVNKAYNDEWGENVIDFKELDYKDRVPLESVKKNEKIFIVDFSFKPEIMEKLLDITEDVVWIDHHKTAADYPYQDLMGIRNFNDKEKAGCELVWYYFYQLKEMPLAVKLIGDYDKWAIKMQPDCFYFYEGMKMEDSKPLSQIWPKLLTVGYNKVDRIIENGKTAIQYRNNYCKEMRDSFGYEIELFGYKGYACNIYKFGSKGFAEKIKEYDFVASYVHDGKKFTVSLYSEKIDVGSICKELGGGGHNGAAGFVSVGLPWKLNKIED